MIGLMSSVPASVHVTAVKRTSKEAMRKRGPTLSEGCLGFRV
jgi:hypothetical protein